MPKTTKGRGGAHANREDGSVIEAFHPQLPQMHMSGRQNHGPFLGTLNIRCRITIGIQKGTIILTTTPIAEVAHRSLNPNSRILGPLYCRSLKL